MSLAPYYASPDGKVLLYLGEARDVCPLFSEKGHVIMDPPYSAHVHGKSRAGARKVPLLDGNGRMSRCAIDRAADLGFAHLSVADRRLLAAHAARLASRWVVVFSDVESAHLWRRSLEVRGLQYMRTGFWRKVGGTPQFNGKHPAICAEAVTICHPPGRKTWNGGGKHGLWDEDFAPGETLWWDELTVLDRGGAASDKRMHPTQKPERLMLALVEDFTDPGELVYDFTAGSCTTGIACMRAKGGPRRFVGVERDEKFAERAAKRLAAEVAGSTYHAQERGQQALFG